MRFAGLPRTLALVAGLAIVAGFFALGLSGGLGWVQAAATEAQRSVQNSLAGAVRAIRTGQSDALGLLLGLCFAYGLVHAIGPGHGKFLIGGYGVARRVSFRSLAFVAVLTAMAQAAVAVVMVHAGLWALGWTREQMTGAAEGGLALASWLAIAAIGLWLVWRGGRGLWHHGQADHHDGTAQDHHSHGADCGCGHAHTPATDAIAALTGWRDTLALVAGVAIRPCSGALFLLILTWQLGIAAAGIAGAFAMGAGVAVVTVGIAGLAVWSREGALSLMPLRGIGYALPVIEIVAGLAIALAAFGMVSQTV
jgi:ABC-type nickel/cobalt efflux system permease component RcnA